MRSPLGEIQIICDEEHLLGIEFIDEKTTTAGLLRPPGRPRNDKIVKQVENQLQEYFAGKRQTFDIPISFDKLNGTDFQKRAWKEMLKIPFGETISYGIQAKKTKNLRACRAVGNANGKNPIPIIIPCHRVVAENGALGGFSSGLWRKEKLLALEGAKFGRGGCAKSR